MNVKVAYQKYLKYLALPGLALATAGLIAGFVAGWTPLPSALLLGGLGLMVVGLGFSEYGRNRFWSQRSTEAGANALVSVLAVLAILGLVNFLAVRYSSRVDLTENQIFTLAPESQQVVQALAEPTRVLVFDPNQNPQDRQLLESYRRAGNNFTFEFVNPYDNPRLAQDFNVTQPGMVFVEQGDTRRPVQTLTPSDRLSERTLTNSLAQLGTESALTAYFTQGHQEFAIDGSETGFLQAATALGEKGFTVEPLDFANTAAVVPEDASVVIVAGPATEFFDAEVEALQTYLDRGGSVMLMIDPRTNPNLDSLLDLWGVTLDDRIVLDTSGTGQLVGLGPAAPLVTDYGDHPITRDFGTGRSFFPLVRPVNVEEVPGVTAVSILNSNAQSRAEALSAEGELQFDENAPPSGPYSLGVALSRPIRENNGSDDPAADSPSADSTIEEGAEAETEGSDPLEDLVDSSSEEDPVSQEARLVVIGNASFATDGLFDQQLNGDVFLNSVSWLGQANDATLSIRPREVTNRRIVMTVQQQIGLGVFALLILPLVGIILAVLLWLKRR
ncbi:Gldg family protein [Phormidium sp. FACHB-1136]|uniref:GldG family protein n=1 Tax=Phormidium sp. FACHB-1136 TaxID=2692848 RepID=UPI001684CA28|nr:Gldg family protein [Phormidium sp. FACHB-1136]MBD2425843.1 Gldg family protein [Phormidium sp. FACHB-1136]